MAQAEVTISGNSHMRMQDIAAAAGLAIVAAGIYGLAAWYEPQGTVGTWLHEVAEVDSLPDVPFAGFFNHD